MVGLSHLWTIIPNSDVDQLQFPWPTPILFHLDWQNMAKPIPWSEILQPASFQVSTCFHPPARAMFGIKLIANGSNLAALARRWGGIAGVVPKWVGLVIRWVKTYFNGHFRNRFIGGTYHIYVLPFLGLCKGMYHQHIALYGTVKARNTSSKY